MDVPSGPLVPWLLGGAFSHQGTSLFSPADLKKYSLWVYSEKQMDRPSLLGGLLEPFTRTSPLFLVLLWAPLIAYFLSFATFSFASLVCLLTGYGLWSFMEYTLHRFVFHSISPSNLGVTVHFVLHGIHHKYPGDDMRLVMPPALGLSVCALLYLCLHAILFPFLPPSLINVIIGSTALSYVAYDLIHFALRAWRIHAPPSLQLHPSST